MWVAIRILGGLKGWMGHPRSGDCFGSAAGQGLLTRARSSRLCARRIGAAASLPEAGEPRRAEFSVPYGMLDALMSQPVLDCPGIVASISQRIATAMAQHVDVDAKRQRRSLPNRLNLAVHCVSGERSTALSGEYEGRVRKLPAKLAEHTHFIAAQRMRGRLAILDPAHMKHSVPTKLHLRPFQVRNLSRSQPMSIRNQELSC
jgi:hypothetical protein